MSVIQFPGRTEDDEKPAGQLVDDGSDEVTAVTDAAEGDEIRETIDIPRAIDPPAKEMSLDELVGRWDLPNRRVILPPWVKSWKKLKLTAWWCLRYAGYLATFHSVRLPKYALRALVRLLVGQGRVIAAYWRWLWDSEGRKMAVAASMTGDQGAWKSARKEWTETVHRRLVGSAVGVVCLGVGVLLASWYAPPWAVVLVGAGGLAFLVRLGRPEAAPLMDVPMDHGMKVLRLTSAMVLRALGGLGIAKIDAALKEDPKAGIRFFEPPTRDKEGAGFHAGVELPFGVTAADVVERRDRLASGLKRPLGCVWPEGVQGDHPGRLSLFVSDEDMNKAAQPPWSLRTKGVVDIFQPQPFGTDPRGRVVKTRLMYACGVIGSVPRVGKTFALRELLLMGALDPRVKVYAFDKKGSGDLSPLEHVAHAYTVGDEDEDIERDLIYLRDLQREMKRRYKKLRELPKERAPETKVNPDLANDRSLGMEPILMGVDECQRWFEHTDKKTRDEFIALSTDLVKRGPAAGIMCFFATQKPDATSIPTAISANAVWRFALKVMDHTANDQVLGSGQYKAGVRATVFSFDDLGIGYLVAEGANARIVKTFGINATEADKIGRRARTLREQKNRLTGYAAGEDDEPGGPDKSLVDDLPAIFEHNAKLHSETILELLADHRPGAYVGWTTTTFGHALRSELGIGTKQVRIGETNRQGLTRQDVADAVAAVLEAREKPQEARSGSSEGSA